MSINEKNFFDAIDKCTIEAIKELNEIKAAREEFKAKLASSVYSWDYKKKVIEPAMTELAIKYNDVKERLERDVEKHSNELVAYYKNSVKLDASKLTDDVKLFQLGLKLPAEDVIGIYNKYDDNPTMQKIIHEYVKSNEYDKTVQVATTPTFEARKQDVTNIKGVVRIIAKNHDNPSVYEQFMGEGSELRASCYA